jgi:hypothetical protein
MALKRKASLEGDSLPYKRQQQAALDIEGKRPIPDGGNR